MPQSPASLLPPRAAGGVHQPHLRVKDKNPFYVKLYYLPLEHRASIGALFPGTTDVASVPGWKVD